MNTNQPTWKFRANLGDASPLEYGGAFVYEDTSGVYAPELELIEVNGEGEENSTWTIYRLVLELHTFEDWILSDNPYRKDYPAWYADSILSAAECCGIEARKLIRLLCSNDSPERAYAYQTLVSYFGAENFDSYPIIINSRAEMEARYTEGEL